MKKIYTTLVALFAITQFSYAQPYLPLSVGNTNPLTGTLYNSVSSDGVLIADNAGTNRLYQLFKGTNAYGLFGIEGSGASLFTGATPNATVIGSK
jgi:hypothetical protein